MPVTMSTYEPRRMILDAPLSEDLREEIGEWMRSEGLDPDLVFRLEFPSRYGVDLLDVNEYVTDINGNKKVNSGEAVSQRRIHRMRSQPLLPGQRLLWED